MPRSLLVALALALGAPPGAAAQAWNTPAARALVERGIARRANDPARGLEDFRARAHGFVFFLAQLGDEGLREPPRLVKSDQLELEVYWKSPGASKQRIIGWRDRADLPTDINYHRDHLGIVQNGFADRIRLGEGDEVRDVPHPLAPDGADLYDFALVDSLTILLPDRAVRVHEIAFRPREFQQPRIIGSVYLDADGGELVQLRFSFTRAAYLDPSLEDITVVLENGLWDSRYWLPRRQEIEIRRRSTWLDVPARGLIRGRWEIDGYQFNTGVPERLFLGPEIVVLPSARDSFPWREPLDAAILDAVGPQRSLRLPEVRAQVGQLVGGRPLSGLRASGLSVRAFSEVAHVNRVEGLTLGLGYVVRPSGGPLAVRAWSAFGFSDERLKGGLSLRFERPGLAVAMLAERQVADIGDRPIASGVLNSFAAQELGDDYGDYVGIDRIGAEVVVRGLRGRAGMVRTRSVPVAAGSAAGVFRPNPALGTGDWAVGSLEARGRRGEYGQAGIAGRVVLEGGVGDGGEYLRAWSEAEGAAGVGPGEIAAEGFAGWGSEGLALHRVFVLGGRGTLLGEPFRAYGGRAAAWGRVGWRFPVPFPAVPLGQFASTGRQLVLEPFVAAGWSALPVAGGPWLASEGVRPVVGLGVEVLHRLIRVEAGWAVRAERVGLSIDVRRELWPIL